MSRYEMRHTSIADSAGLVVYSSPGFTASSQAELEDLLSIYDYVPVITSLSLPTLNMSLLYSYIDSGCPSVLLESLGPGRHARYSIIAYHSALTTEYTFPDAPLHVDNPLDNLLNSVRVPNLGYPHYYGGPICAWSYEAGLAWLRLSRSQVGPLANFPDLFFFLPLKVIVYDHQEGQLTAICWNTRSNRTKNQFTEALHCLEAILNAARQAASTPDADCNLHCKSGDLNHKFKPNMNPEQFKQMVQKTQDHIRCGDIFQAVVSQRWSFHGQPAPWKVYANLRSLNPSPYMFYLHAPDFTIMGASPETQLRVEQRTVTVYPIAGTCCLSGNPIYDDEARRNLLSDEKERAEHLMLVDLARNDIGKVSTVGTVQVPQFMITESYSHVAHIVSEVSGCLKPHLRATDAFRACFPAGTLTGAPKRKAMEIINNLEEENRGIYGGAVGYVNFNGDLDSGIAIRTILWYQGTYYLQSGAGIVADSDPGKEYEETLSKSRAMMLALLTAEEQQ